MPARDRLESKSDDSLGRNSNPSTITNPNPNGIQIMVYLFNTTRRQDIDIGDYGKGYVLIDPITILSAATAWFFEKRTSIRAYRSLQSNWIR